MLVFFLIICHSFSGKGEGFLPKSLDRLLDIAEGEDTFLIMYFSLCDIICSRNEYHLRSTLENATHINFIPFIPNGRDISSCNTCHLDNLFLSAHTK